MYTVSSQKRSCKKKTFIVLSLLTCLFLTACSGGSSGGNQDPDENTGSGDPNTARRGILENVGTAVTTDFQELHSNVSDFSSSLSSYCGTTVATSERAATQASFNIAMASLQKTLMYEFGPASLDNRLQQVYSWPTSDSCQIDLQLAQNNSTAQLSTDRRGIDAIEYLLYTAPDAGHSCSTDEVSTAELSSLADFDALSDDEKQRRRCDLMLSVTANASENINTISTEFGSYQQTLTDTPDVSGFLNLVTNAMFYFEETLKENKLGQPLGGLPGNPDTVPSCGSGIVCSVDRESPNASLAKENLIANVSGLETLFFGGDVSQKANNEGFDDWLNDIGEAPLATEMETQMTDAISSLNALNGSLGENLTNNTAAVEAILTNIVNPLGTNIKSRFLPAIGLQLPSGSGSDTD